jgi:hypothetical protein
MTRDEFELQYATASGITVDQLHVFGRYAEPCNCGDVLCRGWQMIHIADRLPEPPPRQVYRGPPRNRHERRAQTKQRGR